MNIEEYKNAMNEITVNTSDVALIVNNKLYQSIKSKQNQIMPMISTIIALSLILVLISHMYKNNPTISITVYAKEQGEIDLSNKYVLVEADAAFFLGGSSIDNQGNYYDSSVNYNLKFNCVGENIKYITYTCSDKKVTRDNRQKASAYYVENKTTVGGDFYQLHKDDTFLYGFLDQGTNEAHITYLVGSSYTVLYDEQFDKQYGLVVPAEVDEYGNYHVKDLVVNMMIHMKDGSRQTKKIKIHFLDNAYSLEVKILR
ncbi:MAG: hypothetical protein K0S41_1354 [Anaerocolumna sp.]|jgi:hypothetical protein|nr:hypothetical protein [Anaerocolumna sp.]